MTKLNDQKISLRKMMLEKRKALMSASFAFDHILAHEQISKAQIIAGYWPMAGELDIRPLLQAFENRNQQLVLPVVSQKACPLIFQKWNFGDDLIAGAHGTKQPVKAADILQPDLVIVPLLAFDRKGGRLGFGGGYYDRTLVELKAVRVGVGYDEQQVDAVPMDEFDQRLDWIVTPTRVIRCS